MNEVESASLTARDAATVSRGRSAVSTAAMPRVVTSRVTARPRPVVRDLDRSVVPPVSTDGLEPVAEPVAPEVGHRIVRRQLLPRSRHQELGTVVDGGHADV